MISEVKLFLDNFFQAELNAYNAKLIKDLNKLNDKVEKMYSFCLEDLKYRLNIGKEEKLRDDSFYEKYGNNPYQFPRFLFKISHYKNEEYGDLFLAYTTIAALQYAKFLMIDACLFIANINGNFKILKESFVYDEDLQNIHWREGIGVKGLCIEKAGEFVSTERFLKPTPSPRRPEKATFNIEEYNKDR